MQVINFDLSDQSLEDIKAHYEGSYFLAEFTLNKIKRKEPIIIRAITQAGTNELTFHVYGPSQKKENNWHNYYSFSNKDIILYNKMPDQGLFNYQGLVYENNYTPKRQYRQGFNHRIAKVQIPEIIEYFYRNILFLSPLNDKILDKTLGSAFLNVDTTRIIYGLTEETYPSFYKAIDMLASAEAMIVALNAKFCVAINPLPSIKNNWPFLFCTSSNVIGHINKEELVIFEESKAFVDIILDELRVPKIRIQK